MKRRFYQFVVCVAILIIISLFSFGVAWLSPWLLLGTALAIIVAFAAFALFGVWTVAGDLLNVIFK